MIKLLLLTLISICFFFSCSLAPVGDGGTSSEVIAVTGDILDITGLPVSGVQVMMIPGLYNPDKNTSISENFKDTTNSNGVYCFKIKISDTGIYNIQAVDNKSGKRAFHSGIKVYTDAVIVPAKTINTPGNIKVYLPDSINITSGYIFIPGTNLIKYLNGNGTSITIDSVAEGVFPSITYSEINKDINKVLRYNIKIISNQTTVATMPLWKYSQHIYFNTTASGAHILSNIMDFPVLIRLTENNFNFKTAESDGKDIRFTKPDNSSIPYEIEYWDAEKKEAAIWIKIDTIYGNDTSHFIVMAWGNQSVESASNSSIVFDTANGFRAVWHLNNNCIDATANKNNGRNYGTIDTAGIAGFSKKFNGSDSIQIPGLMGTPASITLSAWASLEAIDDSGSEVVSVGNVVLLRMDDTRFNNTLCGTMGSYNTTNSFRDFASEKYLVRTGWHHLVFSIDNTIATQSLYIDGVLYDSSNAAIPVNYSGQGQNTFIGKHGNKLNVYNFIGRIDEVRIYRIGCSAEYIKLCYLNQKEQDMLVKFK